MFLWTSHLLLFLWCSSEMVSHIYRQVLQWNQPTRRQKVWIKLKCSSSPGARTVRFLRDQIQGLSVFSSSFVCFPLGRSGLALSSISSSLSFACRRRAKPLGDGPCWRKSFRKAFFFKNSLWACKGIDMVSFQDHVLRHVSVCVCVQEQCSYERRLI